MRLFISHASEDKADFVRPLVDALRVYFDDVWLDEDELRGGTMLFDSINAALVASDYGVAILSPAFLVKKWTRAELGALFALEERNRKMIIPVVKDLDVDDIKREWPILADRLQINAAEGPVRVAELISLVVANTGRAQKLSQLDVLAKRMHNLDQTITQQQEAANLYNSREGVQLVAAAVAKVCGDLALQTSAAATPKLPFSSAESPPNGFVINAPRHIRLSLERPLMAVNNVHEGELRCEFYRLGDLLRLGEGRRSPNRTLRSARYHPNFGPGATVIWREDPRSDRFLSTDDLVVELLNQLYKLVEDATCR